MNKYKVVVKRKSVGYRHYIVEAPDYISAGDWVKRNAADFECIMGIQWMGY